MNNNITDEQAQQLLDGIVQICEQLDLESTQILDGLSRSLLSAAQAFGTKDLNVQIDNVGKVTVKLQD
ncbi:hypothetical protein AN214_00071 [Pseudoalteromonas sp. P1-9]|uniref:hypothetical protein n=1 Tax=Pseudoalteromonas sp. P1-9 TaxID=1710354 RepID=UPI0006D62719|nr:hypothetical protein [Pseudoalteromonas sp. P1-9]KPV98310.1 hypothetical protein AN214_00071 [Pseudoalteromonas sp. P1-9]